MSEKCPHLSTCAFFRTFYAHSTVLRNSWIQLYCEDKAKSENCVRKQMKAAGKNPPDNMAPTGKILQRIKSSEREP